jgi:hypothetical protein
MWNKDLSSEEIVRNFSSKFLNSFDMFLSEFTAAEFGDELVVVDFLVGWWGHGVWIDNEVILLWVRVGLPCFAAYFCY